jgi:hypothetical protein
MEGRVVTLLELYQEVKVINTNLVDFRVKIEGQ